MAIKLQTTTLFIALAIALPFSVLSQENELLSGRITAPNLDGSTVHIINTTQGTGTVNSSSGNFQILVRQNDTLLFSSIQYYNLKIPVTAEVLDKQILSVELTEDVNELAEVNLSNLTLTGNLDTDLANIETFDDLPFSINFGDIKDLVFEADINDPLKAPVNLAFQQNQINYGENIAGMSFDLDRLANLFGIKSKPRPSAPPEVLNSVKIRNLFDDGFFISGVGIKEENIKDFIFHLDDISLSPQLFKPEKRLALIEELIAQGKIYTEGITPKK